MKSDLLPHSFGVCIDDEAPWWFVDTPAHFLHSPPGQDKNMSNIWWEKIKTVEEYITIRIKIIVNLQVKYNGFTGKWLC